jgi:hypothetical protein
MSGDQERRQDHGPEGRAEGCGTFDDDLAELALGVLTGKSRVAALAHVDGCSRCASEVERLAAVGDELLALSPSAEPPVGFEAGVFARMGLKTPPGPADGGGRSARRWGRRSAVLLAVAAGLVFAVGAVTGAVAHGRPGPPDRPDRALETVALTAGGRQVGDVMVYAAEPTWIFMYMHGVPWTGALRCEVTVAGGRTLTLGRFWLSGGKGAWAASTSQPAGRLGQALVVGEGGQVLARAQLS